MPERLTVYHLDSEKGLRGGERQLLYLAAHLRRRGHENIVVCRRGEALCAEASRQGFAVMHLPFLGEWDPVSAWRLARASAGGHSILHAHTGHTAALACLAARFGGAPWVAHRRVDFPVSGPSARFKYGSAGAVIAVSDAIRGILESAGLGPGRTCVVADALPCGPDEEALCGAAAPWGPSRDRAALRSRLAAEAGFSPEHLWVGNLAALVPHKDQANLVRAAALVVRREPRARFLILGAGPLEGTLNGLAESLGVRGAVRLLGRRDDARSWLQSLDLYCQPSWGEGLGSVLLEAMACRVPIVATTAGGIPEVVSDGRSALLVPPRDPAALAAAIVSALQDKAASARRAEAAAGDLERFSVAKTGDAVLGIYAQALGAG
ncbi:MAG: glycosyltransferase [Elusimicrobia bacterium]|nr:glycosyltransferase [Elusimicrobiota bacterium]